MANIRFVVVIRQGSETEDLFRDNYDALDGDRRVLHCADIDLSGYHARIVRIPAPSSKAGLRQAVRQNFWIPASDIALAFEFAPKSPGAGFGGSSSKD